MESFHQMGHQNSPQRASFLPYLTSSLVASDSHHSNLMDMNMSMGMGPLMHLQSPATNSDYFHHHNAAVKSEVAGRSPAAFLPPRVHNDGASRNSNSNPNESINGGEVEGLKAKIIAHPQYSNLLQAFMDCQKVGAPPEVAARLTAQREECETRRRSSVAVGDDSKDPELDQFMEAYYDMLVKYREELTRPVEEAMEFMRRIESQLAILTNGRARINNNSDERSEGIASSEEDPENSAGETELPEIDPRAEDRELKNHLLKKYSGYLSSLKQELSKKKKKGKLPKEARQKLLSWWELHYKWPYPSESEKAALAEATGLDQKQINNWFINQRKRHWKPSEDMQMMVMEGIHSHSHNAAAAAGFYMEGHFINGVDAPYRFGT